MMKRYILFAGVKCYPSGGWGDYIDSFNTIKSAKLYAESYDGDGPYDYGYDWYHILDTKKYKVVYWS